MVYVPPKADEIAAIATLRDALKARDLSVCNFGEGESEEDTLLRYLRSRNGLVEKAADKYAATLAWRESIGLDALRKQSPLDALGCDVQILRTALPHAQVGVDRRGGPLIFKHMGAQCRVRQAVESGATLDGIARYNIWLNESYMNALAAAGAREWSVVVDAAGWHIGLLDSYAFTFLQRTAKCDAAH